jgi:hypothetical protein
MSVKKYTVIAPIEHDGVTLHPAPIDAKPVQIELDARAADSLLVVGAIALPDDSAPAGAAPAKKV